MDKYEKYTGDSLGLVVIKPHAFTIENTTLIVDEIRRVDLSVIEKIRVCYTEDKVWNFYRDRILELLSQEPHGTELTIGLLDAFTQPNQDTGLAIMIEGVNVCTALLDIKRRVRQIIPPTDKYRNVIHTSDSSK